jgi:hypothetical protein
MNLSVSTGDPLTLASFNIHSGEGALIHAKTTKTEEPLQMFFDSVFGAVLRQSRER